DRRHRQPRRGDRQVLSQSATPPCFEQAPRRVAECEYVPSLHFAVAPVGSVFEAVDFAAVGAPDCFAALLSVFAVLVSALMSALAPALESAFTTLLVALLSDFAAFAALLATPPCPEQAPLPVAVDVVPSLQVVAACACNAKGASAIVAASINER